MSAHRIKLYKRINLILILAFLLFGSCRDIKPNPHTCWPLVFYHKSESDFPEEGETPYSKAQKSLLKSADITFQRALARAHDDESKAKIEAMFGNYKSVMERYPGTKTVEGLRGRCDTYWDYHLHDPSTCGMWWVDYGPNHALL